MNRYCALCGGYHDTTSTACPFNPISSFQSASLPTHAEVDAFYWDQFKVKGDGTHSDALWATLVKFGPRFAGGGT